VAKHRKEDIQPGDRGWKHPDVKGETDPDAIKDKLDAVQEMERNRDTPIFRSRTPKD
jgi:hypothetical protein